MIENPVSEQEIRDVLDFLGENVDNAYIGLMKLILKYVFRVDGSENEAKFIEKIDNAITVTSQVVVDKKELRPYRENRYTITNKTFISEFLSQLKITVV